MTPDQLDAIEARANAATPGPWRSEWDSRPYPREGFPWCSFAITPQHGHPSVPGPEHKAAHGRALADAAFIAAARTDIPALVARVRQLEADLHAAGVWAGMCDNAADRADRDAELIERRLNEEIAELRATLANETGLGAGPSEGWGWATYSGRWGNPNGWSLIERGLSFAAVGRNADGTGWDWHAMVPGALRGGVGGTAPTAREAMRQADLARAGGAT